jgi:hypothetical protein
MGRERFMREYVNTGSVPIVALGAKAGPCEGGQGKYLVRESDVRDLVDRSTFFVLNDIENRQAIRSK